MFMNRYIRLRVIHEDPAFAGTLRDRLNLAEKLKIIDDAKIWLEIRSLRNITGHEYSEDDLETFFENLLSHTPTLISIRKILTTEKQCQH